MLIILKYKFIYFIIPLYFISIKAFLKIAGTIFASLAVSFMNCFTGI